MKIVTATKHYTVELEEEEYNFVKLCLESQQMITNWLDKGAPMARSNGTALKLGETPVAGNLRNINDVKSINIDNDEIPF